MATSVIFISILLSAFFFLLAQCERCETSKNGCLELTNEPPPERSAVPDIPDVVNKKREARMALPGEYWSSVSVPSSSNPLIVRDTSLGRGSRNFGAVGSPSVLYSPQSDVPWQMWYSSSDGRTNDGSDGSEDDGNAYPGQEHQASNDVYDGAYSHIIYAEGASTDSWPKSSQEVVIPGKSWPDGMGSGSAAFGAKGTPWEGGVMMPHVIHGRDGRYHMWFTGMWFYSTWVCDYLDPTDPNFDKMYKECTDDPGRYASENDPRDGKEPWFGPNKRDKKRPGPPCEEDIGCDAFGETCSDRAAGCCFAYLQAPKETSLFDDRDSRKHSIYKCAIYRAHSILYTTSADGKHWDEPVVVLHPEVYNRWKGSRDYTGLDPFGIHNRGDRVIGSNSVLAPFVLYDDMGTETLSDDLYRMWLTASDIFLRPVNYTPTLIAGSNCTGRFIELPVCYNSNRYRNDIPGRSASLRDILPVVSGFSSLDQSGFTAAELVDNPEIARFSRDAVRVLYAESKDIGSWKAEDFHEFSALQKEIQASRGTAWEGSLFSSRIRYSWASGAPRKITSFSELTIVRPWTDPKDTARNCNYIALYSSSSSIGVLFGQRDHLASAISWTSSSDSKDSVPWLSDNRFISPSRAFGWSSGGLSSPAAVVDSVDGSIHVFYDAWSALDDRGWGGEEETVLTRNGIIPRSIGLRTFSLSVFGSFSQDEEKAVKPNPLVCPQQL